MPKKSRTPPPPRRVQAPKVRTGREGATARQRKILYLVAGSGIVALAAVLIGIAAFGRGDGGSADEDAKAAATIQAAGCGMRTFKAKSRDHLRSLNQKVKYNSFPPTNGPHWGEPLVFGPFDEPVNQKQIVHNLEHGGMYIQYGKNLPTVTVDQIQGFYREHADGLVVAPLPKLGNRIALGTWNAPPPPESEKNFGQGRLAICRSFDEQAFAAFYDTFAFRGPESCQGSTLGGCFRKEDLAPGR